MESRHFLALVPNPLATVAFCLAIHPDIMALQKKLHAIDKNNLVIACSDDVYVVADMDSLPLIEQFGKDINANTDLTMVPSKSNILGNPTTIQEYYTEHPNATRIPLSVAKPLNPEDILMATGKTAAANESFTPEHLVTEPLDPNTVSIGDGVGISVANISHGDKTYINTMLTHKLNQIQRDLSTLNRLLKYESTQCAILLLNSCFKSRFDYWLQCQCPDDTKIHAERFDKMYLQCFCDLLDQNEIADLPANHPILQRLRLPAAQGGAVIARTTTLRHFMFMSTLIKVVPLLSPHHVGGKQQTKPGYCPQAGAFLLGHENPYTDFSEFACDRLGPASLGSAFLRSYNHVRQLLENPEKGLWSKNPKDLAFALKNVPPQKNLTRELNGFLEKQLDDRIASWKDKLENTELKQIRAAWLSRQPNSNGRLIGCGPSYNQGFMTNNEYITSISSIFALTVPFIRPQVGTLKWRVKNSKKEYALYILDPYGNNLTAMAQAHHVEAHDNVKWYLGSQMKNAHISHLVEPMGIFTPFIKVKAPTTTPEPELQPRTHTQQLRGLKKWEATTRRGKQGYIPDIRYSDKQGNLRIADVKLINNCETNYQTTKKMRSKKCEAVNHYERSIYAKYMRQMRTVDHIYNETPKILGKLQDGPCTRHMNSFGKIQGLCVGAFGERSQAFEKLIDYIAEEQAGHVWLLSGYRSSAEAKGVIKYRFQTEIAIECMRSRARKMTQALATRLNPYGSVQRASKYASLKWEKERERRVLENDRTKSNGGLTFSFSHHHRSV